MTEAHAIGLLVLRTVSGLIFIAQGSRKLFAPPDSSHGRMGLQQMIASMGIPHPAPFAWAVSVLELVCGTLILIGLLTQLACLPPIAILLGAIRVKFSAGFIGGWDWPLSVLGSIVALALVGPGSISLDAVLAST